MKNLLRFLSLGLILLTTLELSGLDETDSIIAEAPISIQIISLEAFGDWPGVNRDILVDASLLGGRLNLIWPGSVISLDLRGRADELSLLSLFATSGFAGWTAENGVVSSEGYWIGVDPQRGVFHHSLLTGERTIRPVEGIEAGPIYPATDGGLLTTISNSVVYIDPGGHVRPLRLEAPLSTLLAVSAESDRAAWLASDGRLNTSAYINVSNAEDETENVDIDSLPAGIRWGMEWLGNRIVIAMRGSVVFVEPNTGRTETVRRPEIPRHWYKLRGGSSHLILISPEEKKLILIGAAEGTDPDLGEYDFSELLKNRVLAAGESLVAGAYPKRAEAFYAWTLPMIRNYRSRRPLDFRWSELEKEITERRAALRADF